MIVNITGVHFSALQVQETQHILSNMSDLLFLYQSLFLYSLYLADVADRFQAVFLSVFFFPFFFFVVCANLCFILVEAEQCTWTQRLC